MSGRFEKGTSGNPAGRPRGARNKRTLFREALVVGMAERIAADIARRARAGEAPALSVLAKWQRDWMRQTA